MVATSIRGTGFEVGVHRATNDMLARITDTSDAWIRERSGIEQRYYVEEGTSTSDLAVPAAEKALADAKMSKDDIDYIVFATMTPDYYFPGCGSLLQHKMGLKNIPALDIRQQCSGFVYGLQVCDALIKAGTARNILFVGSEIHTGFMPWTKHMVEYMLGRTQTPPPKEDIDFGSKFRHLTVLFGDAAGALVLSGSDKPGILACKVHSDGKDAEALYVPSAGMKYRPYYSADDVKEGRYVPSMDGKAVFRAAVTHMPEVVREVLADQNLKVEDIDLMIAHQANLRINEAAQKALGIPDSKVYNNIQKYGNTTAATIPVALDECRKSGRIKSGDLLCFVGLGAGFHWGAALYRA
jgi:3-oxoacyl-[acyl-carrier-protein] synthase III